MYATPCICCHRTKIKASHGLANENHRHLILCPLRSIDVWTKRKIYQARKVGYGWYLCNCRSTHVHQKWKICGNRTHSIKSNQSYTGSLKPQKSHVNLLSIMVKSHLKGAKTGWNYFRVAILLFLLRNRITLLQWFSGKQLTSDYYPVWIPLQQNLTKHNLHISLGLLCPGFET